MIVKSQIPKRQIFKFWLLIIIFNLLFGSHNLDYLFAQEEKKPEGIIINGDTVEYSTDAKEVTASGNVEVTYKGSRLTCNKLTVNTQTKDGVAEGNVRLEDKKGVIEGSRIIYNFENKTGTIIDSDFRSNPYFGKAEKVNKVSDAEFIALQGFMSTCNYNQPHYRIKSNKIDFFPGDKVKVKNNTFYVGQVPLAYLPQYSHSLKDPFMHVQLMPGKKKDWGIYMLSAWRYTLNKYMSGRIYLDYREKLGPAEGFGLNYTTPGFGKGDYKYYYMQERSLNFDEGVPAEFQRYFIRWRHRWNIDKNTDLTSEYYKIVDSKRAIHGSEYNILKDFFPREYEKDSQPLSYVSFHHNFNYSSLDMVMQKRVNRWYTQLEKLPEIKYNLSSLRIAQTPVYFENVSQAANYNYKYYVPSSSENDIDMSRFDTVNRLSLPMRIAFFQVTPFVKNEETFYSDDINDSSITPRSIFYAGTDLGTKFYRIFNVNSKILGMEINGLRHIITPTINYTYNHEPTIEARELKQIDSIDALTRNNCATLTLSNKLQTKRKGQSVDFADFRISTPYNFKPKTGAKRGSSLSDLLFELEALPYSWLRIDADATYKHSGARSDTGYNHFSNANYDINFDFAKERSFSVGQRYQRKGGNEITCSLNWRLNPKWRFSLYQRRNKGHDPTLKRGLREEEYTIARDLHCWTVELTYNVKRGSGESIFLVFRLKAFPEMEFGFDQTYHEPKAGSQSNP
jgi:hypothetical protein